MNPLAIAIKGKGPLGMLKRAGIISERYGLTVAKMDSILAHFAQILGQFSCGATFPITATSLARNPRAVEKYQERNIEFALHGYHHIDHTRLALDTQLTELVKARHVLEACGIVCSGFRSPYLRWCEDTLTAIAKSGFLYDSSQALAWDVVDNVESEEYRRVLGFCGAISARDYPSLPKMENGLVRIPYSLPDDEVLIDRFHLGNSPLMSEIWLAILARTYAEGELFTLGLHPERIRQCEAPLIDTLRKARQISPPVWIARLDEVARWWKARTEAAVEVLDREGGRITVRLDGFEDVTILTRGLDGAPSPVAWDDQYQRVPATGFSLETDRRPFIGVSRSSSPSLRSFLRQQGYIIEDAESDQTHTFYIDRPDFACEDERPLLAQIEHGEFPLVRLGRWPNGARSALCVTGDIDALTLWDYGLRPLER